MLTYELGVEQFTPDLPSDSSSPPFVPMLIHQSPT